MGNMRGDFDLKFPACSAFCVSRHSGRHGAVLNSPNRGATREWMGQTMSTVIPTRAWTYLSSLRRALKLNFTQWQRRAVSRRLARAAADIETFFVGPDAD
jgi:hypothetical protein